MSIYGLGMGTYYRGIDHDICVLLFISYPTLGTSNHSPPISELGMLHMIQDTSMFIYVYHLCTYKGQQDCNALQGVNMVQYIVQEGVMYASMPSIQPMTCTITFQKQLRLVSNRFTWKKVLHMCTPSPITVEMFSCVLI